MTPTGKAKALNVMSHASSSTTRHSSSPVLGVLISQSDRSVYDKRGVKR